MEANTCCLCKQPYYRMDALSGTPRRRVVLPVGDSSRAPYRLWSCGHGAHKLCLAVQGEGGTSMNGPCKVCGHGAHKLCLTAQGEEGTSMNGQCSVPLLPPARRTQKNKPPLVRRRLSEINNSEESPPLILQGSTSTTRVVPVAARSL